MVPHRTHEKQSPKISCLASFVAWLTRAIWERNLMMSTAKWKMHLHYKRRLVTSGKKSGSTSVKELHDMLSWKIKKWKLGRHPIKLTPPWYPIMELEWNHTFFLVPVCIGGFYFLPGERRKWKAMKATQSETKWKSSTWRRHLNFFPPFLQSTWRMFQVILPDYPGEKL